MLKNIFISIFSLLFTLLMAEGAIRLYTTFVNPKMMQFDAQLAWSHIPSAEKRFPTEIGTHPLTVHNRYGHRGPEFAELPAEGKTRVLALGDSFCEGSHVEEQELFSAKLMEIDPTLEVLNAGVGGYSTVQEFLYLQAEGLSFNPDIVLFLVYENDLDDNCLSFYPGFGPRPHAKRVDGEIQIDRTLDSPEFWKYVLPAPLRSFLHRHSQFYYFLNSRIYRTLLVDQMATQFDEDVATARQCDVDAVMQRVMTFANDLLREHPAQLAFAFIPSREEAIAGRTKTHEAALAFCIEKGLHCLDLTRALHLSYAEDEKPYLPVDIHWNALGHKIAADELQPFLQELVVESSE